MALKLWGSVVRQFPTSVGDSLELKNIEVNRRNGRNSIHWNRGSEISVLRKDSDTETELEELPELIDPCEIEGFEGIIMTGLEDFLIILNE